MHKLFTYFHEHAVILDLLILGEAVEGLGVELCAQDLFDKIVRASLRLSRFQT